MKELYKYIKIAFPLAISFFIGIVAIIGFITFVLMLFEVV